MLRRTIASSIAVACIASGGLFASGCGAARPASGPKQTDIALPASTQPEFVALSRDGSVWFTGGLYGVASITRVDPAKHIREFPLADDKYPTDIVEGPDGAMWFSARDGIGRIESSGLAAPSYPAGSLTAADAITSVDGRLAYSVADIDDRIERMNTNGAVIASTVVPWDNDDSFAIQGITGDAEGALWFTKTFYDANGPPDAIGRVTRDGRYTSWPLPNKRSDPVRITLGSDNALWFTEQRGHSIGRITTTGEITEFPLRPEVSPTGIAAGKDGALWFTSDTCVGRITTKGDVTMWPVEQARELVGIAAAPDGSFWIADRLGHALRHFMPPRPPVAAATPCRPPSVSAQEGSTRAVVVYKKVDTANYGGEDFFTDPRVQIWRKGKETFREAVPSEAPDPNAATIVYGYSKSFAVRDLDGDGEPEVSLELNWNGNRCCEWSRIYRFDASRGTYVPSTHFWGDFFASPDLRDVDGDGRPEFVSKDDRFAELTGYAGVRAPIQVWSYDHGKLNDVTRRYPKLIEQDAAGLWRSYLADRGKNTVRYVLAAWAADEYMLDRAATVDRALTEALDRGELVPKLGEEGDAAGYIGTLRKFLRKTGYLSG
jgi:virginiamycin B lyase